MNYLLDTGETPFTYSGGTGSTVVINQGTPDPHVVTMHDGRPERDRFELERDGFHFVRHDTKMVDFFSEAEIRSVYFSRDGGADQS